MCSFFAFAWARVCAPTKKNYLLSVGKTQGNSPLTYLRCKPPVDLLSMTYLRCKPPVDLLTVTYFGWPTFGDHKVTTDTIFSYDVIVTLIPHIAHTPLSSRTQPFFLIHIFSMIILVHGSSKGLFCGPLQFEGLVLWSISGLFISILC